MVMRSLALIGDQMRPYFKQSEALSIIAGGGMANLLFPIYGDTYGIRYWNHGCDRRPPIFLSIDPASLAVVHSAPLGPTVGVRRL